MLPPSDREVLAQLGLLRLHPEDAQRVLGAFWRVLTLRMGRRMTRLLGPAGAEMFERVTELQETPEATERALDFFRQTVPDYEQHAYDELNAAIDEFTSRMAQALDTDTMQEQ